MTRDKRPEPAAQQQQTPPRTSRQEKPPRRLSSPPEAPAAKKPARARTPRSPAVPDDEKSRSPSRAFTDVGDKQCTSDNTSFAAIARCFPKTFAYNDAKWWQDSVSIKKGTLYIRNAALGKQTLQQWQETERYQLRGYTMVDIRALRDPSTRKLAKHDGRHPEHLAALTRHKEFTPFLRLMLDIIRRVEGGATHRVCFACDSARHRSVSMARLMTILALELGLDPQCDLLEESGGRRILCGCSVCSKSFEDQDHSTMVALLKQQLQSPET